MAWRSRRRNKVERTKNREQRTIFSTIFTFFRADTEVSCSQAIAIQASHHTLPARWERVLLGCAAMLCYHALRGKGLEREQHDMSE